ncbi:MAG TPA: hypothetical protein VL625_08275 [Patescibacteria group bacterium]|nr:hypothetical protein [Patescibacteria group bacterium]
MSDNENNSAPQKSHKGLFAIAATGLIAGAAALMAPSFNTAAHVPSAEKNKDQHDLLAPYAGFIADMRRPSGMHCCGMQDGMGKVVEKHTDYPAVIGEDGKPHADPAGTHWHVKFTKDSAGKELPNGGFWMDVPDEDIVDVPLYERVKAEHPDDPTFKAPPFNIIWTNNSFPSEESPQTRPTLYCFWPTPRLQ